MQTAIRQPHSAFRSPLLPPQGFEPRLGDGFRALMKLDQARCSSI